MPAFFNLKEAAIINNPINANCLKSYFYSKKNSHGSKADKDGKAFERAITSIIQHGYDVPDDAPQISKDKAIFAKKLYEAIGITQEDVKFVTCLSDKLTYDGQKNKLKTDVLIGLKNGEYISLTLKNTKAGNVGVLETSLDALFENFSITDDKLQSIFYLFKNKYKFAPSRFLEGHPKEFTEMSNFFKANIKSFLIGLLCGHNSMEIKKPDYIVFHDKVLRKVLVMSIEEYIDLILFFFPRKHKRTKFEVPFLITNASGQKDAKIKFKIYNPLKYLNCD